MQVTRLLCGGFILAFTFNHVISDGFGVSQFLTCIAELAGGARKPSVPPVWEREILNARDPPPTLHKSILNDLYKPLVNGVATPSPLDVCCRTFFFGKREVDAIRARVPKRLQNTCTSFELIVACVLHCRITSLQHSPDEQVGVLFPVNCRSKFVDRPIPVGYYGNTSFLAIFTCLMEDLHDLGYGVEQVKKAKEAVNEDYARSMVDIAIRKRRSAMPNFPNGCTTYAFNDWSRLGFSTLDFGSWGKPLFAGQPYNGMVRMNFILAFTKFENGDKGRLLNLYMPEDAMDSFLIKLQILLHP